MIRFCDREVGCVEYSLLSRIGMLAYFLPDNKDGIICVYDDMHGMEYMGIVTYHSLQNSLGIDGAILRKHVVLCADLWLEARRYFAKREKIAVEDELLPVLDQSGQLICFAYEDQEANREVRMLRELEGTLGLLQFSDIYPQYKCVKILECNELAFLFAQYLEKQNIAIQVEGAMWQGFIDFPECQVPEYECLTVYAEGIWEKKGNWKENLLRSVSVEFECIDKIYEANIKNNLVKDAWGDCTELVERLRGEKEIIIYGTGRAEQNAYDFLVEKGIDVCCFVDTLRVEKNHRLFGKKIVSETEAWCTYKNAVFIDCVTQNSAWGFGKVDYYDYIGYRRNEKFICLKDYIEITGNSLINIIRNKEVVLLGDLYLCNCLYEYFIQKKVPVAGYLCLPTEDIGLGKLQNISVGDIEEETICLLVAPEYSVFKDFSLNNMKQQIIDYLAENRLDNYTDYFSDMDSFINIEDSENDKYTRKWMKPKRIVLGSIECCCGNEFFRGLLDNHPSILMIDSNVLNNNLFWICVRLSVESTSNILALFWEMLEVDKDRFTDIAAFNEKMKQLLAYGNRFTSQELFVMFHIAYAHMHGQTVKEADIADMIIYWEPHFMERFIMEEFVRWLGADAVPCDIVNVVRNICMRNGSMIKLVKEHGLRGAYYKTIDCPHLDKKSYHYSDRIVVRFEDIKCDPRRILAEICDKWGIIWSDTLMTTTCHGKESAWNNGVRQVKDFDLEPVYNTYEIFYSEFDRFRIMLIHAPWQRKYGYPYVELSQFTRRELQEMFLKRFRFDNLGDTERYRDNFNFRLAIQTQIKKQLLRTRMIETLQQ